jgi:succinylarginine dihydrolase
MPAREFNFDGIIGPTHNYAGLSYGNVASMRHRQSTSNPKQAALEGLAKMRFLAHLGIRQAVLPPQERPNLKLLRSLGFTGSDAAILESAHRADPAILASACSASSMWAANAATVSPSADTADGRVHFTPANLVGNLHRSIEPQTTTRILRAIFSDPNHFMIHDPLPATSALGDEGAANHTRLCAAHDQPGIELFTFGRSALSTTDPAPTRFPARQSREASAAIARRHLLDPARALYVQQSPLAIDAGAFHNDVVAVGNENVLFYHERAFADFVPHETWTLIPVFESQIPLADAIATYLFNSQLVTLPDGSMSLICPLECRDAPRVRQFIDELITQKSPLKSAHFVDVRQSMHNGGGPACLRLRVVLSDVETAKLSGDVVLTDALHESLVAWVNRHYREVLNPDDLRDPQLLNESRDALDELSRILVLSGIYEW